MRRLFYIIIIASAVLVLAKPSWADYTVGLKAFKKKDYVTTIKEWTPVAEKGNAKIQFLIGIIHYRGLGGVPKNYKQAVKWLAKASQKNIAKAQDALGFMYEKGHGVPKDLGKAVQLYRKAAAQGLDAAKLSLKRLAAKVPPPPKAISPIKITLSKNGVAKLKYKGISLVAVPPSATKKFKVELLTPEQGIKKLHAALDLIYQKSPYSVAAIETLKKNGNVTIIYSPNMKQTLDGSLLAAVFLPEYYRKNKDIGGGKDFVVIVSLNGIKWPTPELAMVLVHELVGHGMQQYLGQLDFIRVLDLECTANLYGERFYQDIKINKQQREIIQFRQALEGHWCSDFKRYMRKHQPAHTKYWDMLNPDVPKLLNVFNQYAKFMRDQGISGRAIQASKKDQQEKFEKTKRKIEQQGTPEEVYQIGRSYRDGLGTKQNRKEAVKWFYKAAKKGHLIAQASLGDMYLKGLGVPENHKTAVAWYSKAAHQGHESAQLFLGIAYAKGKGVKQNAVQAYAWVSISTVKLKGKRRNEALNILSQLQKAMPPAQITKAKQIARQWIQKHPKK